MILSDKSIKSAIITGDIQVSDTNPDCIQPASLDIRLGNSFSIPVLHFEERYDFRVNGIKSTGKIQYMNEPVEYETKVTDRFVLYPFHFVLGTTLESFKLANDITAFVEGRSSIGRLGLFIQNAGWVDPGFEGEITLELFNAGPNPIELIAGTRVGQLVFEKMDQAAENPYNGKYQGQQGATGSMLYKDF